MEEKEGKAKTLTVEEYISRWLEQPGTFVTPAERTFIADMRKAAAFDVGYGWMQQIIDVEWRHAHAHGGRGYFSREIERLETENAKLRRELAVIQGRRT